MSANYQPWTWEVPAGDAGGKGGTIRQDAFERVSGQAIYTRDIHLPGMLYAKILPSPYAHAKIKSIDTSQAEALVGVRDILRFDDPDIAIDNATGGDHARHYNILTLPGISDFYYHPMGVVVVADNEEICDRAMKLIKIGWEERQFVLDFQDAARSDAPKIMTEVKRLNNKAKEPNIVLTDEWARGDVKKGFDEADKIIEYTIKRSVNSPAGVEPMVCIAQWRGEFLELYVHQQMNPQGSLSSQSSFREKPLPPFAHWTKITVTFPYQGSMFGGLSWLAYSNNFTRLAVILARRSAGRPVKLLYDESNFYVGGDEAGYYNCKVGAKNDGTITAAEWHMDGVRNPIEDKTYECTSIPNLRGTQTWAFSNVGHLMCYRHGAHGCVPHGIMLDRVASELGLDPTVVALKNDGCRGHDWDWVTQYQKDNGFPQRHSLAEVIELGKKAIGWDKKWHEPGTKKLPNGKMHGIGFMSVNEWRWEGAGRGSACLILRDGKVTLVGMRCDMGIDTESGFRHCVAGALGVKYEDTVIQEHRSDSSTFTFGVAGGSMGTVATVSQLILASRELKQKILELAVAPRMSFRGSMPAHFPDKKPEDLDIRDSMVFEKANPSNSKTLVEVSGGGMSGPLIAHPSDSRVTGLTSDGKPDMQMYIMGRQAHFIEVEVDTETGEVQVSNIVCVNDVGHIFNRAGAEAQQYGGAVMGLGRNVTEEKIFCPQTGVGLNFNMLDYKIGTMNDYPPVQCILNESHLGYSAYGSYGIGENVGASMSAIVSHAVYNAIGKRLEDFPLTPDKVLKALGKV